MNLKKVLSNNFYCKLFFLILPFLNEIPLLMPYLNPVMKFGLVLAVVYLLSDLVTFRQTLRMHYIVPVVFFLLAGLISCVLNLKSEQASMNIISFFYNACTLLVLFPVSSWKTPDEIHKEFATVNLVLLLMISVSAAISLIMFFGKIQIKVFYSNYEYCMGYHSGRLVGLLRNAIYPTFAIGIFCGLIQLALNRRKGNSHWLMKTLLGTSILINLVALVLQQSKGLSIGMYCAVFFIGLCIVYRARRLPGRILNLRGGARLALGVPSGAVATGVFYGFEKLIFFFSGKLVALITFLTTKPNADGTKPSIDQVIDEVGDYIGRDEISDKYGAMTGRPYVWGKGLSWFMEKPLFGHGSHTLANYVHPYEGSKEQLTHFHNIFIQTLVSYGIVGFAGFVLLVVLVVTKLLKKLFCEQDNENLSVLIMASALIVFLFVTNMADTTILYMFKHSGYVFFIYLGYILYDCGGEACAIDRPIHKLADWIDGKVHHAK